ncbi:MAG: PAS domain S-box protein, partial [Actinomycetota bacterium]|nr:PAS domain S-box protein [Actinomycetota bacterium]
MPRALVLVYALASAAGTAVYFLLPGGSLAQALVYVGLQGAMVVAIAVGIRVHRPPRPLFWKLMLAAEALGFVGYLLWYVYPLASEVELTFPGPYDPPFLVSYALLVAALGVLVRTRSGGRNRTDLIDATIIALALGLVFWVTQIARTYFASGLTPVARVIAVSYPIFDLLLAALGVRLAVGGGRRSPAFWFLGVFVTGQLVADIVYAETVLRGTFRYGAPHFAGWLLSFAFLGAAALHPSMRDLAEPATGRRRTTLRRRLPLLSAASLVGPVLMMIQEQREAHQTQWLVIVVTGLMFLLVLARVSDLMVDLAEYEKVQERLSELALIVESSGDAILGWTTAGIITSWNRGATELYGYQPEEVLGQRFSMLLPPHRTEEAETMLDRVLAGERLGNFDSQRLTKDGRLIDVSVTLSAVRDSEGRIASGATIARDITERKRLEAELAAARDQALEASRLKSEFLANMSHEVRTPMNGVIGLTGLLLGTDLDPRQRQYAEGVQSGAEALLGVIKDILDFSKIEAGKLDLEVLDFDLRQVVEEAADLLAQPAQRKGLELVVYCNPDLPTALRGDAGRLRQVLLNLVSNSVKFTERGEVVVRARAEGATDGAEVAVRFEVAD